MFEKEAEERAKERYSFDSFQTCSYCGTVNDSACVEEVEIMLQCTNCRKFNNVKEMTFKKGKWFCNNCL